MANGRRRRWMRRRNDDTRNEDATEEEEERRSSGRRRRWRRRRNDNTTINITGWKVERGNTDNINSNNKAFVVPNDAENGRRRNDEWKEDEMEKEEI